jgi:hypothetical protein
LPHRRASQLAGLELGLRFGSGQQVPRRTGIVGVNDNGRRIVDVIEKKPRPVRENAEPFTLIFTRQKADYGFQPYRLSDLARSAID